VEPPPQCRREYQDLDSEEFTAKLKGWISACDKHHGCNFQSCLLPRRVLYLGDDSIKLIESRGEHGKYVALSHCWGEHQTLTTTMENLEMHMAGIEFERLGKTFQDVVTLTRRLGISYLWIDSLCIVQNWQLDWERESAAMASVFKNAYLTVAATKAANGNVPLFQPLENTPYILKERISGWWLLDSGTSTPSETRFRQITHPKLWQPYGIPPNPPRSGVPGYFWMALEPDHDGFLFRSRRVPRQLVEMHLPLFSRAWTLQELVLSPKILHFGPSEVYWECGKGLFCECPNYNHRRQGRWESPLKKSARSLYINALTGPNEHEFYTAWHSLVQEYSRLWLTVEDDRLPALSGIAKSNPSKYLAGIWEEHLPQDLYWRPAPSEDASVRRPLQYRAPTISWASVEGPVDYFLWRPVVDLDEDVHRRLRQGHVVATLTEANLICKGVDPHGAVRGGAVTFYGWTGTAVVSRLFHHLSHTICEITKHGQSHRFPLDMPMHLCLAKPAEVQPNDTVKLLLVECEKILQGSYADSVGQFRLAALVLKPSDHLPEMYERVGLIFPAQQARYIRDDDKDAVVLQGDIFKRAPEWFEEKGWISIV
jgi:hypothetical protein